MPGEPATEPTTTSAETRPPLLTRPFLLLACAHTLYGLSFFLFLHLPAFITGLGGSEIDVGLVFGATSAVAIASRPWMGKVMDDKGRRPVLVGGGLLGTAASAAYLLVGGIGPLLYAVRIAHGLSEAMLFASLFALAADRVPPSRRIEGIGLFGVSGLVPMAVGGAAGDALIAAGGYALLFLVATGLNVAAVALSLLVTEAPHTPGEPPRGLAAALVERALVPLWAGGLLFATALAAHFTFLKTMVKARDSFGQVGDFFAAYAIVASLIRVVAGSLPERVGPKRVLAGAIVALAAGQCILAWASTRAELVIAGALSGAGHGYTFPILLGLVVTRARPSERGVALAIFTALFDAGTLVGGPLLGWIAKHADYRAMFLSAAGMAIAGGAVLGVLDRRRAPESTATTRA